MARYQKGDVRSFEVLLARHRKPIYNFIYRFVGERAQAEEQYSDYRKVNGIDVPYHAVVLRDGGKILERTLKSVTFNTTVDPTLFEQPLR